MAKELIMPKLGAEMTAGKIVEWKKPQGGWVQLAEVVVVIETDKLTYEVESPAAGYLYILKPVEEEVPVSTPIGMICESQEELQAFVIGKAASLIEQKPSPSPAALPSISPSLPAGAGDSPTSRRDIRISPVARKLAAEHGLDITTIEGGGDLGRIEKQDVLRALEKRSNVPFSVEAAVKSRAVPASRKSIKEVIPMRGMRKVITERLHGSLMQMAQFTEMGEIDVTETVAFRNRLLEDESIIGVKISYNDILVKVVALVLREQPIMNASLVGEEIHVWNEINIGIAVSLEGGLVVPVIWSADKMTIVEIHRRLEDLIERGRNRKLTPDEIAGGTFTISNFGSYGAFYGTPIINPPEVALLGLGAIRQAPAVIDNQIVIRWSMAYGLTMDHRVIDGATGGRFIQRLKQILGNPNLLGALW